MNTTFKRASALLLALMMAFSITACGTTPANTSSSNENVSEQPYELQMEIAQADWNDNRQYIELSTGITMAYVEMGNPDGDPLILIHGSTDNSRSWSMTAPYFAEAGYHVYMPDLRGHGYSDKPDTGMYTSGDYAADISCLYGSQRNCAGRYCGPFHGLCCNTGFSAEFPGKM